MNAPLIPFPGNLLLVLAPSSGGAIMWNLLARLACQGSVLVLDGGNRFNLHAVARALHGQLPRSSERDPGRALEHALARVRLSRAFTCYQMETLLKEIIPQPVPILVLDLLCTFYDESVSTEESQRILESCLGHLRRLNRVAPVAISAQPGPPTGRRQLLETLQATADHVWLLEPGSTPPPPRLL
jgi:uncharacterized protein (DUF58 family)